MVGEDRDGVRSALQVLFPFGKSKDDGEELSIIYVIVAFVKDASLTQTYSFLPTFWAGDTHEETDFLPMSGSGRQGTISKPLY